MLEEATYTKEQRIRLVVYCFIAFEMVMLYQTSNNNWGTIIAGILCCLIVLTHLLGFNRIKVGANNIAIFLFVIVLFVSSLSHSALGSKFFQVIAYALLYILLSSLKLYEKEVTWLVNSYLLTGTLYSLLIIHYR